jgi:beta-xylosidase
LSKSVVETKTTIDTQPDYKNPDLPVRQRINDLLNRMTLEEKVAQMMGVWEQRSTLILDENENISIQKLRNNFKNGIGQIGRINTIAGGLSAKDMALFANALQDFFVEETRLGIPVIVHEECLHGLVASQATSYPQPIALASTFNTDLVQQIYSVIADNTRSRGAHQALTPVVDVARDPRWGRVEETFGEDSYLVAQMGIAAVQGLQGDGSFKDKKHVIATLKHFAAHGQPESGSNCGPVNISERVLRDTFLYPFKEAISKGGAISIMASYNEIDGVPSHANTWLLMEVLRDEWNFDGFVVSDYYAITEMFEREKSLSHGVARDKAEAALLAIHAGVNIELPEMDCYLNLVDLVENGRLQESEIDALVAKVLEYKFKLGLFEDPYVDPEAIDIDQLLESERELALKAAQQSIVLLKNENSILPIDKKSTKTIAVIGPNADRRLLGGYSGQPGYYASVLQGIKQKVNKDINILYSEGCKITVAGSWDEDAVIAADLEEDEKLIKEAVQIAQNADIVIMAIGGNEQTSREAWAKNHLGDRASLDLFGNQNILVKEIIKTGKPVVVLLFNGRPLSVSYLGENVQALLECWYLGQETGQAVADILFGDYNPAGKLPISFPRSAGHIPCHYSYKPSARRGYLFDEISALFPFGYGKSYTTFSFGRASLEKERISKKETVKVYVDVTNKGDRAGDEVIQLYIRDIISSVTRPVKELKGFKRIHLKPGESRAIEFNVLPEQLAFTNINKEFTVEAGDFEIMIGNSSLDKDLQKMILHVS